MASVRAAPRCGSGAGARSVSFRRVDEDDRPAFIVGLFLTRPRAVPERSAGGQELRRHGLQGGASFDTEPDLLALRYDQPQSELRGRAEPVVHWRGRALSLDYSLILLAKEERML